ncbi:MAG: RluA family pseudouridine synthase, partial [Oscillospiraceae bacterium]|nr:RluA family pseudouridine synthase [Oscillospiraceae bacterium]
MRTIEYKIPPDRDGAAVGRFLRGDCGLSRRLIASLKHRPLGITANGIHIRTVDNLRAGDVLAIRLEGRDSSAQPTDIPLNVIYEDDDLIVIDKPAYMPIHPTHGHITDTLANAYAAHARKKGEPTSFHPIGRLDRNTTGLVVGCKNRHAANLLQNRVKKTYLAVCEGALTGGGTVDAPIRRKDGHGVRREVGEGGLPCVTHW